jgi:hypothetical protein
MKIVYVSIALGLAAWPATAYAQLTAPPEAAEIQLGPVGLYPSLQIVDAGKDSNVFEEAKNPKEDYTFTVQSRALLVTKVGLNELMFSTGGDYVWFRQYRQERSSNAQYAMRLNLSASRLKPFVGAERIRERRRPTPEIDVRARRLERAAVVGSNLSLTERTALTATAQINDSSYEAGQLFRGVDLATTLSSSRRTYSGGVRYAVTPLTTLVVTGRYEDTIFRQSHIRDSKAYGVDSTLEFSPDAALRGRVVAGMQIFRPVDRALAQYTGPTFLAALNWSPSDTTIFDVVGTRNVSYSYKDSQPYYLLTGGRLTVSQKVIGPFDVQGTVDRQYLSYRWRPGETSSSNLQDDTTDTIGGGIGINIRRGFKVLLTAERTARHSNVDPSLDYRRTRLLTRITLGS